jgi:hypothetical protein
MLEQAAVSARDAADVLCARSQEAGSATVSMARCRGGQTIMKVKQVVFAAIVSGAVLGSGGVASADILIGTPPSPVAPPECCLVQQPAPVDVSVLFGVSPGPPDVSVPPSPI